MRACWPGYPIWPLAGLADDDARELLGAAIPGHLDTQVQDRIVAETQGNPLALLEVSRVMSKAELLGGFALPLTATQPGRLQDHYVRRIKELPPSTRQLLLLAAADPTGDATLVWRSAHALGLGPGAAAPAEAEQLIEIRSRVSFRHPLVRSAAYAAGSDDDRRDAHLALAAATAPEADPARRIWHLATAASEPDEDVAAELERMADEFEGRGGLPAAAAFLRSISGLDNGPRTARRPSARSRARAPPRRRVRHRAGPVGRGPGRCDRRPSPCSGRNAHRSGSQSRQVRDRCTFGATASSQAARTTRRQACPRHLSRCLECGPVAGALAPREGQLLEVSRAARAAPPAPDGPEPGDLLLDGLAALMTDGLASAEPSLRSAVDAFLGDEVSIDQWLHWGVLATNAALAIWDFECWVTLSTRHVELARASGALTPLANAINVHRAVAVWCGDFEAASSLSVEEDTVKEVTGTQRASYGAVFLAAYQGDARGGPPPCSTESPSTRANGAKGSASR